jgi:tRNA A-37 threonylcarbamoyl transferase component Bud32
MDPMIGRTIGKYRIVEHLGRGGMAEVYKAYQPNLDRYVAIKMMHAFLADEKEFLSRFEREAKVVATLRHPNIVQVYDFDVESGVYYMVMEFISGETLKSRMQDLETKDQWISLDDAARVILSVGSALKYAHERGMVHRDVKPANVMITLEGQVILTDFGIAKIVSASNLTASGAMVGTPSYMAPEQGMGQPGDERSDIYSLGVMLYQLVLGRLPYDADTPLAVVLKHINEPLPLPKALKPDISDDLNRVILKSLAKDPHDRYQKVADLAADLRKAMGMSPEDSHANAAKEAAIKLTGATMVGRVGGGVTPLPTAAVVTKEHSGTQVSAPKTVVAGAAVSAPSTVVIAPTGAPTGVSTGAAVPTAEKKRPGWLIPALGLTLVAIIAVGAIVVLSSRGTAPAPTPTAAGANLQLTEAAATDLTRTVAAVTDLTKEAAARTPTAAPLTAKLLSLEKEAELRDKAGSDPDAQIEGLLPVGSRFHVKARTGDSKWVRIETPDGVTGWIDAAMTGLKTEELQEVPAATTLTRLTDTPTPTEIPTETPTPTLAPTQTKPPAPTRTPGPTKPPATAKPATPTGAPPSPTKAAISEPLGYGFSFQFCTFDGGNYTCNVNVWGSGGDGKYHFALENPDTGNWEEKTGGAANYLMRSRRCKIKTQQLRVWDESGNHIEPNLTMDPNVMDPALFPGGAGCT